MTTRRSFVLETAAAGALALVAPPTLARAQGPTRFWPGGARRAVLVSMVWESGADPAPTLAAPGPPAAGTPPARYPDLAGGSAVAYATNEGIPRMLDLYRRAHIPVTAFMCGQSATLDPALAREIAQRGHECAAHGQTHSPQFALSKDDERTFIQANIDSLVRTTGKKPLGYNCAGQNRSVNTVSLLQELGFQYHIDDYSRDEPFIVQANGSPFAVVPYTQTLNDFRYFNVFGGVTGSFGRAMKDEFDMLYAEAAHRRRMMVVTMHDTVVGRAGRIPLYERFFTYAKEHPGVWFARTSEVARWALASPLTPREGIAG
jgi:peptidoglycan/xylan/chitin deacetylase (PgdA/CDA1 family)